MVALSLFSCLSGAVLGMRYRVFCLVPAIALGIGLIVIAAIILEASAGATLLAAVALGLGLQMGYAVGLVMQRLLAITRARAFMLPMTRHARTGPVARG